MIVHHAATDTWFLQGATSSYVLRVLPSGHLAHVHWGARVEAAAIDWFALSQHRVYSPYPPELFDRGFTPDVLPQEAPTAGSGDFRQPMLGVRLPDGSHVLDLRVQGAVVRPGKPPLPGLPATYAQDPSEASTLAITLVDAHAGITVALAYTVFHGTDVVTRSWSLANTGTRPVVVTRALSASVDLPRCDLTLLHLSGAWAHECMTVRRALTPGLAAIESRRGASSPQHNPFVALLAPDAGEEHGEVLAMQLVYSGNFVAQAEVDQTGQTRLQIGINPAEFAWEVMPGASFQAPEAVLARSGCGLGGLSRSLHRLYRTRLVRGPWRDRPRPVLLNNWEATYFTFTTERLLQLAAAGARIGCDLFVLDDGWFAGRRNDRSGLGDWTRVDEAKLPGGLRPLAEGVNALGMRFGLWFEPEMVSADSDLYRAHPDWCLHVPGRTRSEGRHQLVLDLGRPEVREHIWHCLETVLRSAPIGYIKWDMNRHLTEVWAPDLPPHRQGEVAHRWLLGVYEVFERLQRAFPDLLIENCASGGGRFDLGMLHHAPQIWCSDNSDAIDRLRIQHGTSIAYPLSAISAHVSCVPNHQVGRTTPLFTRAAVATTGSFGYELDLLRLPEAELEQMRELTTRWRAVEAIVRAGDLYRLIDPAGNRWAAWMCVTPARDAALVTCVRILAEANAPRPALRLRGLDPAATYRVEPRTAAGVQAAFTARGDALMAVGLRLDAGNGTLLGQGDFPAITWQLQQA